MILEYLWQYTLINNHNSIQYQNSCRIIKLKNLVMSRTKTRDIVDQFRSEIRSRRTFSFMFRETGTVPTDTDEIR